MAGVNLSLALGYSNDEMNGDSVKLNIPRWMVLLYGTLAVLLAPWIVILAEYLPSKHLSHHWATLWVGFDVLELVAIIFTFYFMVKQTVWVVISATALATLLIGDAWVDILTAKPGGQLHEAIFSGFIEVGLSIMTFRLVFHVLHHSTPEKRLNLNMKKGNKLKT
jgi:hypothetical protein